MTPRNWSTLDEVVARLDELGAAPRKVSRDAYVVRCPLHDDDIPSLTLRKGFKQEVVAFCFGCGETGVEAQRKWFAGFLQRLDSDERLAPTGLSPRGGLAGNTSVKGSPVAAYEYVRDGVVVARKVRYEADDGSKSFAWFRPYGGTWVSGLGVGVKIEALPLYRGDALDGWDASDASSECPTVYVVEGEKDADNGFHAGMLTVSAAGGASGPIPGDLSPLADRAVIVIADNDPTGLRYASRWVEALTGVARSVRIALPGVDTPKADLTDHLKAGLGPDDLRLMEEPASLGDVLDEVRSWLGTYVSMASEHGLTVLSLWAAHTHAMECWYTTPRILLTSALPGCGKTTALEHLQHLTPNALLGSTASPALLARATQAGPRPLLLDESDLLLDRKREGVGDLTALLNSGYKRGGSRPTLLPRKDSDWAIVEMPTYAPVAFAGIGDHLPEPTLTRTVVLHLDRAAPGAVEDSDWQFIEAACHELRDRLALTVGAHVERMSAIRPSMNVTGRDAEVWRPLITLADTAGGHWPQTAREALNFFLSERQADREAGLVRESPSLTLLKDLKAVWPKDEEFLGTGDLIRLLADHAPEVWGDEARFGTISGKRLSQLLNAYRIRPTQGQGKTKRGYFLSDFRTPWATYVDPSGDASEASQPSNESPALSANDEEALCTRCGESMDPILSTIGHTTHPLCQAA